MTALVLESCFHGIAGNVQERLNKLFLVAAKFRDAWIIVPAKQKAPPAFRFQQHALHLQYLGIVFICLCQGALIF